MQDKIKPLVEGSNRHSLSVQACCSVYHYQAFGHCAFASNCSLVSFLDLSEGYNNTVRYTIHTARRKWQSKLSRHDIFKNYNVWPSDGNRQFIF